MYVDFIADKRCYTFTDLQFHGCQVDEPIHEDINRYIVKIKSLWFQDLSAIQTGMVCLEIVNIVVLKNGVWLSDFFFLC